MAKAYHEALHPLGNLGIQVSMAALENTHIPAHWHEAMEILFCLNGSVRIHIEHEHLTLQRNQLIVLIQKKFILFILILSYICSYVSMLIKSSFLFTVRIWNYITSNAARFLWMIQNPPRIFTSVSLHTI